MSGGVNPLARRVVAAPLAIEGAVNRLGRSLWLHLYLVNVANYAGRAIRNLEKVARDLKVGRETVEEWLARLSDTQLIDVISPSPFLVLKLRSWPGSEEIQPMKAAEPTPARIDVPVSSSHSRTAAISNTGEKGGAGEGEGLLSRMLAVLGESDPAEFRKVLSHYTPAAITQALDRVERTPAHQIRKTKTALFRYLLGKLS